MMTVAQANANEVTPLAKVKAAARTRLIVFSDDWGRHPSSCQHLISQLLPRYEVLWVNTIGTRAPRLSLEDIGKVFTKLWQWVRPPKKAATASVSLPADIDQAAALRNLTVVTPRMYPGFRRGWQRRLNAKLMCKAIHKALGPRADGERRVVITTVPITADLPGRLDVDRWIYYCVDDFSVWPGLDGTVLDTMDRELATKADAIVAVSQTLRDRIKAWQRESTLLTHGIDLKHWGQETGDRGQETGDSNQSKPTHSRGWVSELPQWWDALEHPIFLFWGVVDQRLDVTWCKAIAEQVGTLVLMGPQQSPDESLMRTKRIVMPGPMPYAQLPSLAQAADVLVMPYADLPVTRAIQPLKFKEYLATGKPVITRRLPATEEWSDAADVLDTVEALIEVAKSRVAEGTPVAQLEARKRLINESWSAKAAVLEEAIRDEASSRE
ncbi:MAG: glycosyltransferase [Phycisphaeraceae bacterium]